MKVIRLSLLVCIIQLFSIGTYAQSIELPKAIYFNQKVPQLTFAANEILAANNVLKFININLISKNQAAAIILCSGEVENSKIADLLDHPQNPVFDRLKIIATSG